MFQIPEFQTKTGLEAHKSLILHLRELTEPCVIGLKEKNILKLKQDSSNLMVSFTKMTGQLLSQYTTFTTNSSDTFDCESFPFEVCFVRLDPVMNTRLNCD